MRDEWYENLIIVFQNRNDITIAFKQINLKIK
jgi:hypothetical protein